MKVTLSLVAAVVVAAFVSRQNPAADLEVTVTEGTNIAAVASPDRQSIAMDLQGSLWILPISGGTANKITPEVVEARQPTWAPDGRSLAFQGYNDNAWHIYTIRRDGTGLTALTDGPFDDREPDWSPDGKRIVFASDRFGGIYSAWTADVGTRAVAQVSTYEARMPCWAPSGREVIFEGSHPRDVKKQLQVWVATPGGAVRLAGTPVPPCANGRAHGLETELASTGEDVFPFLPQIVVREALLYTADGHIKYRRDATTAGIVPFQARLKLRRPVYDRSHRDLQPAGPQRTLGIVDPAVSPDGSKVAFGALGDLWVLDVTGNGPATPVRLTNDRFVELDPAWSPDGAKLVFSSDRGGHMDLWQMDMATHAVRQLTDEKSIATGAAWAPNGSRIAYVLDRRIVRTIDLVRPADPPRTHGSSNAMDSGRPTWGADGRIFMTGQLFRYDDRYREGTNQVVVHSIDSERPLSSITLVANQSAGNRQNNGPVWSPDGGRMAFVSEGQLMVVGVNTAGAPLGQPVAITTDSPDSPTWQKDSRHIVYLTPDGLRRVSADGGTPETIPLELTWTPAPKSEHLVVHAGQMFDGLTDRLQAGVDIVIDAGRIREVKPHEDSLHSGTVVDASGETVLPGLIEMHAHLDPAYGDALGRLWLAYGVTTVRNPAVNPYWGHALRESWDSGHNPGPRVFNAGDPFDGTRIYYAGGVTIASDAQLERELDRATRLHYDFFKTYVRLPDRYQKRVIEYAHEHGLAVTSHEIYPAAAFGVDGVEHIRGTSRRGYSPKVTARNMSYGDVIAILTKSGMTLTPTIGIGGTFAVDSARDPSMMADVRLTLLPPVALDDYRKRYPSDRDAAEVSKQDASLAGYRRTIAAVVKQGGRVIAGTDSPIIPYGLGLHSELFDYVAAGLTPFQVLQTATIGAAEALGLRDDLGSIEPGKLADLVFVGGDPLRDIRAARDVRRVMREGKLYEVSALIQRP